MSPLHTRGYRPRPGERAHANYTGRHGSRWCWDAAWSFVRGDGADPEPGPIDDLARACLDAREEPDPLYVAAQSRRAQRLGWRVDGIRRTIGSALAVLADRMASDLAGFILERKL